jgi:hypothetical protein
VYVDYFIIIIIILHQFQQELICTYESGKLRDDIKHFFFNNKNGVQECISHWGVTSLFDWKPHQQHCWFVGGKQQNIAVQAVPNNSDNIFRCATKILAVMLFLRLEELGLLFIDDVINRLPYKVARRHVFSNNASIMISLLF